MTLLPAHAAFVNRGESERLAANLSHLQSAWDAATRALDDKTPDELTSALADMHATLLAADPIYGHLRAVIKVRMDRLYQQNGEHNQPQEWPAAQQERLSHWQQEAGAITEAHDTVHFMRDKVDDLLKHLRQSRAHGVDPLDLQYDLYAGYVRDIGEQFDRYKQELGKVQAWQQR